MIVDLQKLKPYIEDKLISVQKHPEFDLYIYNYTQKAQYSGAWDEITKMCRGLILDGQGRVVARPFDKFFNRGEQNEPHSGDFVARNKLDGSLGILYPANGNLYIATRGSFVSSQAIEGTKILHELLRVNMTGALKDFLLEMTKEYTYLFEIIYPQNRIVVDYKGMRNIIFLAMRSIETGYIAQDPYRLFGFVMEVEDFEKPRKNSEGVVLYYEDGFMEKVKYEEYVRLHRLVTGCTARSIWDLLRNDQDVEELLQRVPEEFASWVKKTKDSLMNDFAMTDRSVREIASEAQEMPTRKEQAEHIIYRGGDYSGAIFACLDGKDYSKIIWKMLRPAHETPFKKDIDA
jgi:RNA ligase